VNGGIRTKYSGSLVSATLTAGMLTTIPIDVTSAGIPGSWDFTNTLVLVSCADGSYGTVLQARLASPTSINVIFLPTTGGATRLNWIIFKL